MNAKIMRSFLWTVAFVALIFPVSITSAQQGGGGDQPDLVGEMDKDGDGKVSKAEWNRNEKVFTKYDKNNNGYIDSDEKPTGIPTFELMDINGDGKVTEDEFPPSAPDGMFKEYAGLKGTGLRTMGPPMPERSPFVYAGFKPDDDGKYYNISFQDL